MTTIRDVASLAGVAPMTVSRVINDSDYVSDKTRAKVEAAIDELGYVPNMLGPSLHLKRTNTLALVLTDVTNPFWTTIARGVEDAAQEKEYGILLCNTDESTEKQDQYLTMLLKRRIDGIILAPTESSPDALNRIQKNGVTAVIIDRAITNANVDIIRGDSLGGAIALTQHLLDLGHRKIMMLAGPRDISTSTERVAGYRQTMQAAGATISDDHVIWGKFSSQSGYEMAQQALAGDFQPTAFFTANNFIAIGALQALREADLRAPEDVSIVSFGDIPIDFTPFPFFTVATHAAYDMGYQAAQMLITRLTQTEPSAFQEIIIPAEIIIRQSTGPAPES